MPFFKRNDLISLWYLDEGEPDAPTILLVHGLTCDLHDWSWQVPFLIELGFRVISLDLRGHGKSSAPAPTVGLVPWPGPNPDPSVIDYYPQTCAYDAAALLDHLSITSAVVMGHSQGDLVTYFLTVARPDLVRAVIGIDPIYRWDNAAREANAAFFDDPEGCVAKIIFYFSTTYPSDTPAWLKAYHARRAMGMDEQVLFALCWGGFGDPKSLGRKESIIEQLGGKRHCPRLTFGSDEEAIAVDRDDLAKGRSMDECVIIGNKGHWFHQTDSDRFNATLKEWLGKIGELPKQDM